MRLHQHQPADTLSAKALSRLAEGIRILDIPPQPEFLPCGIAVCGAETLFRLCSGYLEEIALFNRTLGLVASDCTTAEGRTEVVVRHILDSLAPWRMLAAELVARAPGRDFSADPLSLGDAGSGGGFPGLPLAMLFPGIRFSLLERMEKRCVFLQDCRAVLALENVSVVNREIEKITPGQFDAVTFRAFRPLEKKIRSALLRLLRAPDPASKSAGGFLAAWKGKAASVRAETEIMRKEGFCGTIRAEAVSVPFLEEERHLVQIAPEPEKSGYFPES